MQGEDLIGLGIGAVLVSAAVRGIQPRKPKKRLKIFSKRNCVCMKKKK